MSEIAEKNKLPDGRSVRVLEGPYSQRRMFYLPYDPKTESILDINSYNDAFGSIAKVKDSRGSWWRTGRYGVYAKGFESDPDKPIGKEIRFVDDNGEYVFKVPDVRHPHDKNKGLRQASGMIDFDISRLAYDYEMDTVSVSPAFNPETDVRVIDLQRCDEEALPDEFGYPLRTTLPDSEEEWEKARIVRLIRFSQFNNHSNGWHGSIAINTDKEILAWSSWWDESGVAVARNVARESAGIKEAVFQGTPGELELAAEFLAQLKK